MRTGASLTTRITVAPVESYQLVRGKAWDRHPRVMPLAELLPGKHFAAMFVDITACPAELLTKERRIATLSDRGIFVLQQRLIKHYTRAETELEVLRSQSAPVLTEAQLLWDWLETVLSDSEIDEDAVLDTEAEVFEEWMRSGTPSRQERLRAETNHADVRRDAQRASVERARVRQAEK
ncbi:hypothetical protein A9X04_17325 [Mycobacterium sp. E3247]|nr:hypothetical protein A9X04_17325 [Mycobacterium sp. E3247]